MRVSKLTMHGYDGAKLDVGPRERRRLIRLLEAGKDIAIAVDGTITEDCRCKECGGE